MLDPDLSKSELPCSAGQIGVGHRTTHRRMFANMPDCLNRSDLGGLNRQEDTECKKNYDYSGAAQPEDGHNSSEQSHPSSPAEMGTMCGLKELRQD